MAADVVVVKLVQKIALGLMISQVFSDPAHIQTSYDAEKDSEKIVKTLNGGCEYLWGYAMKYKSEEMQSIDPEARLTKMVAIDPRFQPHLDAYSAFCKSKPMSDIAKSMLTDAVAYYNEAMKGVEEDKKKVLEMKNLKLPQSSVAYDSANKKMGDVYQSGNRRVYIPLSEIPPMVRYAFLAAEDKNFYGINGDKDHPGHHGVDEAGILRAAKSSSSEGKHPVGGSTITQQVIKNLIVGAKVEESRKIREMYLSVLVEQVLPKDKILEIYMNQNYFGTSSWGIKVAAETSFGKLPKDLTVVEAAYLAALQKCPNSCGPSNPENLKSRTTYVLEQLAKFTTPSGTPAITQQQFDKAISDLNHLKFAPFVNTKSYVIDKLADAVKAQFNIDPSERPAKIHTTINGPLQADAESIAQEGAAAYQIKWGSAKFSGPEKNLDAEMRKLLEEDPSYGTDKKNQLWLDALKQTQMPLYDVHWESAVVLVRTDAAATVGLRDGRMMPLAPWYNSKLPAKQLKQWDVVYTLIHEATKSQKAYAELRFRPTVQVAALIMKNDGRIMAMVGGVSRALLDDKGRSDEFNRAVDAKRSPGSTIKSIIYLKALQAGIQPNSMIRNGPFSEAEMDWLGLKDYWSPANYEGMNSGSAYMTLRDGLEESYNQATVRLWPTMAAKTQTDPQSTLDGIFDAVRDTGINPDPPRFPSGLLGTFDVTMLNMATFYSTIANLGCKPSPRLIESIEVDGTSYPYQVPAPTQTTPSNITCSDSSMTPTPASVADGVSFYQLRSILQGVPVRGTAVGVGTRLSNLIPANGGNIGDYLAVKTGTSNSWRDAWMIGFTQDLTIAVWVGYDGPIKKPGDKTKSKPRTLGNDAQGAKVAGPIFEGLFRAAKNYYPLKPFAQPPDQIAQQLVRVADGSVVDYLRRDPNDPYQDQRIARPGEGFIDPNDDPSQNYVYTQPRPRRPIGPMDSDMADYGQPYDGRPAQQPYVYNRQARVPQQDFFGNLFGRGWGRQEYDEDQVQQQQQPRSRQQQRRQAQPQQQQLPGFGFNPFNNNRW